MLITSAIDSKITTYDEANDFCGTSPNSILAAPDSEQLIPALKRLIKKDRECTLTDNDNYGSTSYLLGEKLFFRYIFSLLFFLTVGLKRNGSNTNWKYSNDLPLGSFMLWGNE